MSLVRLEGVVREIGTFVILDHIDAAIGPTDGRGLFESVEAALAA